MPGICFGIRGISRDYRDSSVENAKSKPSGHFDAQCGCSSTAVHRDGNILREELSEILESAKFSSLSQDTDISPEIFRHAG